MRRWMLIAYGLPLQGQFVSDNIYKVGAAVAMLSLYEVVLHNCLF